ncbi:hypothetical protein ACLOJK_004057 [Asimina triloba]
MLTEISNTLAAGFAAADKLPPPPISTPWTPLRSHVVAGEDAGSDGSRCKGAKQGRSVAVVGSVAAAMEERRTLLPFSAGFEEERHDGIEKGRPICAADADQSAEKATDRTTSMLPDLIDVGEAGVGL